MEIATWHQFNSPVFNAALASAISPLADVLEHVFGSGAHAAVFGPITWIDLGEILGIMLCALVVHGLVAYILRRQLRLDGDAAAWRSHLVNAVRGPIFLLIWTTGVYLASGALLVKLFSAAVLAHIQLIGNKVLAIAIFMAIIWFFFRLTQALEAWLTTRAANRRNLFADLLLPMIAKPLRMLLPVMAVIIGIPLLGLSPEYAGIAAKASGMLLIVAAGIVLVQIVASGEQFILMKYNIHVADNGPVTDSARSLGAQSLTF
ncbi:MAG: hypothetical protein ACP5I8_07125 [Phycisphaerae bacterium]